MRKVLQQLKQYKRETFLCIGLTALEVIMEILMPFITAMIIDKGISVGNLPAVYRYGAIMVIMAFLSLFFGAFAGKNAAGAASGLAANLREAIYANIQDIFIFKHRQIQCTRSGNTYDNRYHQRAECIYDVHPCRCPRAAESYFQLYDVSDYQSAFECHVFDCRCLPYYCHRINHGCHTQNI